MSSRHSFGGGAGLALLTGLVLASMALGQNCNCQTDCCPPYFKYRFEGAPKIKFKHGCPKPICDPCHLPHFGVYQPCWQPWPFPPDWTHCAVPPPAALVVPIPPKKFRGDPVDDKSKESQPDKDKDSGQDKDSGKETTPAPRRSEGAAPQPPLPSPVTVSPLNSEGVAPAALAGLPLKEETVPASPVLPSPLKLETVPVSPSLVSPSPESTSPAFPSRVAVEPIKSSVPSPSPTRESAQAMPTEVVNQAVSREARPEPPVPVMKPLPAIEPAVQERVNLPAIEPAVQERLKPPMEKIQEPAAEPMVRKQPEPPAPLPSSLTTHAPETKAVETPRPKPISTNNSAPPMRMVNSRRVLLDYDAKDLAGMDQSVLELWYTLDGRHWFKDETSVKSGAPYVVEVNKEGTYGFMMVARGLSEKSMPPAPGEAPQVWVEVDWSKPVVNLVDLRSGPGPLGRSLALVWTATDNNLAPKPITLSYSEHPQGPWKTFAAGVENTGRFVWQVPNNVPANVYVRIEAFDLVGNIGVAQTPQAVQMP